MTDKLKEGRCNARRRLLHALRGLSSFKYQKECWVKNDKYPPGVEYDDVAYTVDYFYIDYPDLTENPSSLIGFCLDDIEEVKMIESLVVALDVVFEDYFFDVPDIEIITLPEWKDVLKAAKETYDFFRARMEKEFQRDGRRLPPIHYLDDWF